MTTEIGIVSEEKSGEDMKRYVVLASDKAATTSDWKKEGDYAYRQQARSECQKIFISDNREFAVCMSGVYDDAFRHLLYGMLRGKVDVRKNLTEGEFPELASLTLARWGGKLPTDDLTGLLIASRFDNKPKLHTCWPLGRVDEKLIESIGSGSRYALEYVKKQGKAVPYEVSLADSIDLAVGGIKAASEDLYTGGLDLVAVTDKEILEFGKGIDERVNAEFNKAVSDIKSRFYKK